MRLFGQRRGFTLMEVNLAIFIMAAGVLAMVSLYPLAFRENEQSKEDVKSAAAADAVLNTITAALSDRNITWQQWKSAVGGAVGNFEKRGGGWMAYCTMRDNSYTPQPKSTINSLAQQTFSKLVGAYPGGAPSWPVNSDLACALVAQWGRRSTANGTRLVQQADHSRVTLSLRCTRNANALFSAPIYYTEIHFQGDQKDMDR